MEEAMKYINKLETILKKHFAWDKRRIDCFAKMLISLLAVQTVNLAKIVCYFVDDNDISVRYRRVQRFFKLMHIGYDLVAKLIFCLFEFSGQEISLTMDRTNWEWGKKSINVLFLGIVYKGVAIPIYWLVLNKKGNSSSAQRIVLVNRFIKTFGKENLKALLADREFIGKRWFTWLIKEEIPFYIRVKGNAITTNSRNLKVDIDGLFYDLKPFEKRILKGQRSIYGCQLYITGSRSPKGDLMIIVSNIENANAIEIYCLRWEIETLFSCFKTRGFNFEDTHMFDRSKVKKLIAVLAIAFCWAHRIGEWRAKMQKPIRFKKHGRPEKSIFRYGLDLLQDSIAKLATSAKPLLHLVNLFEMWLKNAPRGAQSIFTIKGGYEF